MIQILTGMLYALSVVGVVANAGAEAFASFFTWRSRLLFRNIRIILSDVVTGVAIEIYRNTLIYPHSICNDTVPDSQHNFPSRLDSKDFAGRSISCLGPEHTHKPALGNKMCREIEAWIARNLPILQTGMQFRLLLAEAIHRRNGKPAAAVAMKPRKPVGPAPTSSAGPAMLLASIGRRMQATHTGIRTGQRIEEPIFGRGIPALSSLFGLPFRFAIPSKITNIRGAGAALTEQKPGVPPPLARPPWASPAPPPPAPLSSSPQTA